LNLRWNKMGLNYLYGFTNRNSFVVSFVQMLKINVHFTSIEIRSVLEKSI